MGFRTDLELGNLGPTWTDSVHQKKLVRTSFEVLFGDFENFEIFEVQVARVRLPDNPHG